MKKISLLLFALGLFNLVMAQDNRPGWLENKPKASNSTYVYVVEHGGGRTVTEAANNALQKVMRTTMMRIKSSVGWDVVYSALQSGEDWSSVAIRYNVPVNKVCEYIEKKTDKGYIVAVLCQVAKSGAVYPEFDDFTACRDIRGYSDGGALLKSVFIPGWGQMSKRRYAAGIFTFLGEVTLVGGAVGTYFAGKAKLNEMPQQVTAFELKSCMDQYNLFRTANLILTTAAGVFYVYNIIRAATISPRYRSDFLAVTPALIPIDQTYTTGLSLTFNF